MAITIIRETEKLTLEKAGSKFFYRRIPGHIRADILQRHTPRRGGDPNWERVLSDMLEYSILGWEGVADETGNTIDFDKELIGYIPQEIQVDLMDAMGAGKVQQLAEKLKN